GGRPGHRLGHLVPGRPPAPLEMNRTTPAVQGAGAVAAGGSLIHIENLSKVFLADEVETHALSGVHLEVRRGEFVSIAGPSGCGKSTLLAILGLLDSPTEGRYVLNDRPVESLTPAERARIRNREI